MRLEIRRALYHAHKLDLGCPKSGICALFKKLGTEKPCGPDNGCKSFLSPVEDDADPLAVRRLKFLTRLESLVNVGCKFGPDDLDARTWSELIMLALERQRMQDKLLKGREKKEAERKPPQSSPEEQTALKAARQELGAPASGVTLFPRTRPMR